MADDDPYREPALYDLEYAQQRDDVEFYTSLAARHGGPVLELGCGNGRILLPIARAGVTIDGIDASQAMLDDLSRKLADAPELAGRVRVSRGDFRRFVADRAYRAVFWPFNAMHHCAGPGEVRQVFDRARGALAPDGLFALDCYLPDPMLYARDPDGWFEERRFVDPRDGQPLTSWENGRWDPVGRVHHVRYRYRRDDGSEDLVHLRLHMLERAELAAIVHQAGFRTVWEAQDFAGAPLRAGSLKWVMVLAKR